MYNPPLPRNPNEALIRRQMEKEKIREEILANEAWSRRELEAEVRRELMMEREMQFRRNASHFPFRHGPPALPYPPPPSWGGGGGGFAGAYSSGLGGFDKEMPFQRIAPQIKPMKTEGKAETEKQNANDRLIFLVSLLYPSAMFCCIRCAFIIYYILFVFLCCLVMLLSLDVDIFPHVR